MFYSIITHKGEIRYFDKWSAELLKRTHFVFARQQAISNHLTKLPADATINYYPV